MIHRRVSVFPVSLVAGSNGQDRSSVANSGKSGSREVEERTWLFTLGNNWSSASRLRIKEEWDFVAECRRKGVPQTQYCRNGFVDTSTRLLDKIERNSVTRQSARVKDRGKRSDPFVFELSGTQWMVSRVSVCLSVCL